MIILGIDPGDVSGWCRYDTDARRVFDSGQFERAAIPDAVAHSAWDIAAIERPVGQGATRPQVVDCAWYAGLIAGALHMSGDMRVHAVTRREVTAAIGKAVGRAVAKDAFVWQALVELHGGAEVALRKPVAAKPATRTRPAVDAVPAGALHGVTGHARAALAVAYAVSLMPWEIPF